MPKLLLQRLPKARRLLRYSPRYTSLEAVAESLDWLIEHGRLDLRFDVRRVVEQILGEPPHPAAQRVHRVVGEVDGEAAAAEQADEGVQVAQHGRCRGCSRRR